ncbi:MAG TPA: tellurite resistance TerB C-terminal domain-containing protein [Stenomitos sp.]
MLRDLWIGGMLGLGLYWWRSRSLVNTTAAPSLEDVAQLQQQLTQAQQDLAIALNRCTALETQVAELNQLATDRAIDLIQLQADNRELQTQVAELSQKRTRKKRTPKAKPVEDTANVTLEPVPVAASVSVQVPEGEEAEPNPDLVPLNLSLIQAKQQESVAAAQLLETVFAEPQSEAIASRPVATDGGTLDEAHRAFVQVLGQQPSWSREELLQVAQRLSLLLDGALELVNEAAFECCDEALTEGDDPVEVNSTVLQELLS